MASVPLGPQPDQAQGNGLASPQQTARGKDKSNPLDWLEALPKSPVTRKMVIRRSLRDRYQMHDPSVGPYPLSAPPPFQFLVEFSTPSPEYVYKEISYQINPQLYQCMEERRIQIIREFYPSNIILPLDIINNIAIRVCTNESADQLSYALKKENDLPLQVFDNFNRSFPFKQRRAARRTAQILSALHQS